MRSYVCKGHIQSGDSRNVRVCPAMSVKKKEFFVRIRLKKKKMSYIYEIVTWIIPQNKWYEFLRGEYL